MSSWPIPFLILAAWLLLLTVAYGVTWLYVLRIKRRDPERYARFKSLDGKTKRKAGL